MTCSRCKATDYMVEAIDPASIPWPEDRARVAWWKCLDCGMAWTHGETLFKRALTDPLDEFERSLVAHQRCGLFGHHHCLPEIWTKQLKVNDAGIVWSEMFGVLGSSMLLSTRTDLLPTKPVAQA